MLLVSTERRGITEQQLCLTSERERELNWGRVEEVIGDQGRNSKIIKFEQGVPG